MGRRRRIYTKAEIDAMVNLVSKNSYEDAAKLMEQQFPNAKYSASQLHTQVKLATGSSPPPRESAMVHTPNLAGAALPPSIISQYSKSESVQSRPVATGLEEVDNYSHIDWSNQMDATDPFQYVITNSFTPGNGLPQVEDLFQVWLQAMKEVTNSIPRIQANSWKTNMLNALYRKFNPEPTSQQPQDNTQSIVNRIEEAFAKRQAMREQKEEMLMRDENMQKIADALQKKVESMDKKATQETVDSLGAVKEKPITAGVQSSSPGDVKVLDAANAPESPEPEPAGNQGKEFTQEKAFTQQHNPTAIADVVGTVPPTLLERNPADSLKELPSVEQKPPPPEPTGYGNSSQMGPQFPPADNKGSGDIPAGQADVSDSQSSESKFTDSSKPPNVDLPPSIPPPPTTKGEDQQYNETPPDLLSTQSIRSDGVEEVLVKPEVTFLKAQPSVNRNFRLLTALVIVGVGIAALYVFNSQVRQWVFSQYVRIFRKASPQLPSEEMSTQQQQTSYANVQGYARVNNPNGVAFF